jgi:hypothetical protein
MLQCLVTATESSRAFAGADVPSAEALLLQGIAAQGEGRVALTEDPERADLILFVESHRNEAAIEAVLAHPLYRRYPQKCAVHSGMDYPDPRVPGLYPSIDRRWAGRLCAGGAPYLVRLNPFLEDPETGPPEVTLLASFMGACVDKPVRQALLQAARWGDWKDIEVVDSGARFVASIQNDEAEAHLALKRDFARQLKAARFVLCPAGAGPSSFRIFEAMMGGRAPVIIADRWLAPEGPDWESFAIRVPEAQIARLPELLKARAAEGEIMGRRARQAWEAHFNPETCGPLMVEQAAAMLARQEAAPKQRRFWAALYGAGPRRAQALHRRLRDKAGRVLGRRSV